MEESNEKKTIEFLKKDQGKQTGLYLKILVLDFTSFFFFSLFPLLGVWTSNTEAIEERERELHMRREKIEHYKMFPSV